MRKKVPCATGENCHSCWHNDTCRLYLRRKEKAASQREIPAETEIERPSKTRRKKRNETLFFYGKNCRAKGGGD